MKVPTDLNRITSKEFLQYLKDHFKELYPWDNGDCYRVLLLRVNSGKYNSYIVFTSEYSAKDAMELLWEFQPKMIKWWNYTDLFQKKEKGILPSITPYQFPFPSLENIKAGFRIRGSDIERTYNPCNHHLNVMNKLLNLPWRKHMRGEYKIWLEKQKLIQENEALDSQINRIRENHRFRKGKGFLGKIKKFLGIEDSEHIKVSYEDIQEYWKEIDKEENNIDKDEQPN